MFVMIGRWRDAMKGEINGTQNDWVMMAAV
jgi:hypothetical protein